MDSYKKDVSECKEATDCEIESDHLLFSVLNYEGLLDANPVVSERTSAGLVVRIFIILFIPSADLFGSFSARTPQPIRVQ